MINDHYYNDIGILCNKMSRVYIEEKLAFFLYNYIDKKNERRREKTRLINKEEGFFVTSEILFTHDKA
jgi:hypothetical protein